MKEQPFPLAIRPWLILGVVATFVSLLGLVFSGFAAFIQAYLFAYMFWLGLSLGCLAIALLSFLTNSAWGRVSRRILEAGSRVLWLMLILFLPIVAGMAQLYPWARPQEVANSSLLQHKAPYLNLPFFLIRAAIYFAVWIYFTRKLNALAQQQAESASTGSIRANQRMAAFGLIFYSLTMTFASIDWMMSLNPDWYSTIYGMLAILGQALAAFAFVLLLLPALAQREPLKSLVTTTNFRDLGALLLTAVMGWAYLAFSQLLIIWSGNLPHEVTWYLDRSTGGWLWVGVAVVLIQFALPFALLISLRVKQNPRLMASLALLILVMRLFDHYWMIAPAFHPGHFSIHWLDVVLPLAIGGLWMAAFTWFLPRTREVVAHEPRTSKPEAKLEAVEGS